MNWPTCENRFLLLQVSMKAWMIPVDLILWFKNSLLLILLLSRGRSRIGACGLPRDIIVSVLTVHKTENGWIAPDDYWDWNNPGGNEEYKNEGSSGQIFRQVVEAASR